MKRPKPTGPIRAAFESNERDEMTDAALDRVVADAWERAAAKLSAPEYTWLEEPEVLKAVWVWAVHDHHATRLFSPLTATDRKWLRRLARQLDSIEEMFGLDSRPASRRIGGWVHRELLDHAGNLDNWLSDLRLIREEAQYALCGYEHEPRNRASRPPDARIRAFARDVALALHRNNEKVTKARGGLFARVLRVLLEEGEIGAPKQMFALLKSAVDSLSRVARSEKVPRSGA